MVVAAIDTGGTKIAAAAVDEKGEILYKTRYPNTGRTGPFIMETYANAVEDLKKRFDIAAVGIGAGGRIGPKEGRVLYSVDIYSDYIGIPIATEMEARCGLPVAVDNDCRVAVYGERWLGAAKGIDDILGIILGTGVGGGYMVNGQTVYGVGGSAGEVGHLILHPGGLPCGCGQHGCVEQYLSGTALWKSYNRLAGREALMSGYEFFDRYTEGDAVAKQVLERFVDDLAVCTISVANLMAPAAILYGGGLMDTAEHWWERFLAACQAQRNPHVAATRLIRAEKGNDAALLGAAWLALQKLGA